MALMATIIDTITNKWRQPCQGFKKYKLRILERNCKYVLTDTPTL